MEKNILHRKQAIVLTAIDVINDHGILGFSTKEIARRQGISESTIFKHFVSKNEIIRAMLDQYSQYDSDIVSSAIQLNEDPVNAIVYFIKTYANYYESYPAITAISQNLDILRCNPEFTDKITNIMTSREAFVKGQFDKAAQMGILKNGADSIQLTDILLGTFMVICMKWRMCGYNFPLGEKVLATEDIILGSFKA